MNGLESRVAALEQEMEEIKEKVNTREIYLNRYTLNTLRQNDRDAMIEFIWSEAKNGNKRAADFLRLPGVLYLNEKKINKILDNVIEKEREKIDAKMDALVMRGEKMEDK
jgi:Glu-tRNA(Gln) amidotransferase subunit E-like FAD-binding protein